MLNDALRWRKLLVNLLVILNNFVLEMAAIFVARRRHHKDQSRREIIFFTRIHLFGMPEKHII